MRSTNNESAIGPGCDRPYTGSLKLILWYRKASYVGLIRLKVAHIPTDIETLESDIPMDVNPVAFWDSGVPRFAWQMGICRITFRAGAWGVGGIAGVFIRGGVALDDF